MGRQLQQQADNERDARGHRDAYERDRVRQADAMDQVVGVVSPIPVVSALMIQK
jgi:hypothetical protein